MINMRGKVVGLVQGRQHLVADDLGACSRLDVLFIQIFEHHHEFIAAQARHRVGFAHTGNQPVGGLLSSKSPK